MTTNTPNWAPGGMAPDHRTATFFNVGQIPTTRAPWSSKPCELVKYHAPTPTLTEGHHTRPLFLQRRLYGGEEVVDNTLKFLCSNCHDSVHEWLYWLLDMRRSEPKVGRLAKAEAQATYEWYIAERERIDSLS